MTYPALEVARYVVRRCNEKGAPISNLKLQKMLYFLWIEYFNATGEALYAEDICAWQFGPVVPEVYYEFCSYAGAPITTSPTTLIECGAEPVLDLAIETLLPIAASTLVSRTHVKGKPWDVVYRDGLGNRDVIPFSLIERLECASTPC